MSLFRKRRAVQVQKTGQDEKVELGKKASRKLPVELLGGSTSIAVILVIWEAIQSRSPIFNPILLPTPSTIARTGWELIATGELFIHISSTLAIIGAGFLWGIGTAIPIGIAIGRVKAFSVFVDPLIQLIRPIPALSFLPLAILWFGIGDLSKMFIVWFGVFFTIIVIVVEGTKNIDPLLIRVARSLDCHGFKQFVYVILRAVLPYVVAGIRTGVGTAFLMTVSAELIGAISGVGYLIMNSSAFFRVDKVFVGIATLAALGLSSDRIFRAVSEKYLLKYREIGFKV